MTFPVYVDAAAEKDIRSAYEWYECQQFGLGAEFVKEIDRTISGIASFPESRATTVGNARLALVRRFPYVICYLFHSNTVHIVAVFHGSREPRLWADRIS